MTLRALIPSFTLMVILALLPLVLNGYWVGQLNYYLVYGLFALSLSVVWGYGGILCLGQAAFFGIGAYVMALVTKGMILPDITSSLIGILAAMIAAVLFALVLGFFLFAGRGVQGAYLAVMTIAVTLMLERLMSNWYALGGYNGLLDIPPLTLQLGDFFYEFWDAAPLFYLLLTIVFAILFALQIFMNSRYGLLLTALKGNQDRLTFFGYGILRLKMSVFALGAAIAGLAGALFVTIDGFASPTLIGFTLSTEVLIWVALGGKEMLLAAFLGAFVTRFAEGWLSEALDDFWLLAIGAIFMVSVVLLPKGLIATPLGKIGEALKIRIR
ncbi:MAG: hypothetical protein JJ879_00770 [Sneathiella sp.]|nr:hypothetical protein [Sneathiella sp.]